VATERASSLEPEYVVLGLLLDRPCHGYDLDRRLQREYRALWHIPQNQLYGILKRLERRGDIVGEDHSSVAGRMRRQYTVARQGRVRFQRWLERPTPASVRALRVAFLTRLSLAMANDRQKAMRIFDAQRKALEIGVARLKELRGPSSELGGLERLSLDLRIRQLETTLAWMDDARVGLGLSA
jgi:DNA-binding PadR family transcriptional regulator